jgi:hydroxypyruvate reductase 1
MAEVPAEWRVVNPDGVARVLVTRELPGSRWLDVLVAAECRVEIARTESPLAAEQLVEAIGGRCAAVLGQLTETWGRPLLAALRGAGGRVYSQYAVGYDNVDVPAATLLGLPVGNTPGVLTETTAELAVGLTFAAVRRIAEGDRLMRAGGFHVWQPSLLLGDLLYRGTVGVVGAGRIGTAYARMMAEGHKMDVLYFDPHKNAALESWLWDYSELLAARGEKGVSCRRVDDLRELLASCDVVSLHAGLTPGTRHMIGAAELAAMREDAVLVNASRGPLVDEAALVAHCRAHPRFRAGLDVYEHEPALAPGLADLDNVVLAPHLGSAARVTREGMATLAAANIRAMLNGWPVWPAADDLDDVALYLRGDLEDMPRAAPSIVNAAELSLPRLPRGGGDWA